MIEKLTHPSILATVSAGSVLALTNTITDVPWWMWGAWAVLGTIAVRQAVRS